MWRSLIVAILQIGLILLGLRVIREVSLSLRSDQAGHWDWLLLPVAVFLTGFLVELVTKRPVRFRPDWIAFTVYVVVLGYLTFSNTALGVIMLSIMGPLPLFGRIESPYLPQMVALLFGILVAKSLFSEAARRS